MQSRNGTDLFSGINSRSQNQNHTVFTVSLKGTTHDQPFLAMPQPSPNQTSGSNQVLRGSGKKSGANMVTVNRPAKIIKARSLIRGAPPSGQAANAGKAMMNVLKKQVVDNSNAPQETLKNNYMENLSRSSTSNLPSEVHKDRTAQPPRRPSNGNNSARTGGTGGLGLQELQLKSLSFPVKDRVQSAKSSAKNNPAHLPTQHQKV